MAENYSTEGMSPPSNLKRTDLGGTPSFSSSVAPQPPGIDTGSLQNQAAKANLFARTLNTDGSVNVGSANKALELQAQLPAGTATAPSLGSDEYRRSMFGMAKRGTPFAPPTELSVGADKPYNVAKSLDLGSTPPTLPIQSPQSGLAGLPRTRMGMLGPGPNLQDYVPFSNLLSDANHSSLLEDLGLHDRLRGI